MKIELHLLDKKLKRLLSTYLLVLTFGVCVGLIYLMESTNGSISGTVERWNGSQTNNTESFAVPENYPKPISEMLITTHNHIFGFAFIFISIGIIFYFNQTITGFWSLFLLIEPFVSTVVTFGSIWLMRFVDGSFVYLTLFSTALIYSSYFIMLGVCIYELVFKKS